MCDSPRVSVVMPVYNGVNFLSWSIPSILKQTLQDLELIVVDDGSTDGSLQLVEEYQRHDDRLRVISRANTGIVQALNDGLSAARGELVARMDSDDVSLPDRLRQQVRYFDGHPDCVALGTAVSLVCPQGLEIRQRRPPATHESIEEQLLLGNGMAMIHPTVMFRRSAILAVGGYRKRYQYVEDVELYFRLMNVGRVANLTNVLFWYRQHLLSTNAVRTREQTRLMVELVAAARVARGLPQIRLRRERGKRSAVTDLWWWADNAEKHDQPRIALTYLSEALRVAPFRLGTCKRLAKLFFSTLVSTPLVRVGTKLAGTGQAGRAS